MKHKRVFIVILVFLIIVIGLGIGISKILDGNLYGLKKNGNFYDNMSDFSVLVEEEPDKLAQTYLESITYQITNIDKEKMLVTIEVKIPQITDEFSEVLDKVISENENAEYDVLKNLAEKELTNVIKSDKLDKKTEIITLPMEENDDMYKIISTQEWNELITGNLEELYIEYFKRLIGGMTDETPQ